MCGRVKLPEDVSLTKEILHVRWDRILDYKPRYNVAPTTQVPVVTSAKGERTLELMYWGLIPAYSDQPKMSGATFNARAETVAAKPAYRNAWKAGRRCLVVVDGFYEWRKGDKQPFMIALGNKQPIMLAGLWEEWRKGAEPVRSCTVITTAANDLMASIHDRMPVILGAEDWAEWLGEEPLPNPAALLRPFPSERMTMWAVDRRIGNVKNQGAELAEPLAV